MAVPCWDPAHGNPPRLNLSLLSLQIPYSSSSPGTYVVSPPAPAVCPFVRSSCGLGGNQRHGRWELGEVFENRERWAVLMFAHPTPALSPQGPPGGGGPPGTPIMPSPAGMSPLRPPPLSRAALPGSYPFPYQETPIPGVVLLSTGDPCPIGNDQFLWLLAFWEVNGIGCLALG